MDTKSSYIEKSELNFNRRINCQRPALSVPFSNSVTINLMHQRGIAQILVLFGILAFSIIGIGTLYFTKPDKVIPSPTPSASPIPQVTSSASLSPSLQPKTTNLPPADEKIHLAGDASIAVSNIKLNLIFFQPQDVSELPYSGWEKYATDWFGEVISFWKRELDNKANITFEVYPTVYKANENVGDYDFNSVYYEVYPWLQQQDKFNRYFKKTTSEFPIFFIYVLSKQESFYKPLAAGSHVDNLGFVVASLPTNYLSSAFKFYSEDSRVHGRGQPAQEAHEMGHALGLQHSTDDPNIKAKYLKGNTRTSDCDLMVGHLGEGYIQNFNFSNNATLLETRCILNEQKQLFFK